MCFRAFLLQCKGVGLSSSYSLIISLLRASNYQFFPVLTHLDIVVPLVCEGLNFERKNILETRRQALEMARRFKGNLLYPEALSLCKANLNESSPSETNIYVNTETHRVIIF